MSEKELNGNTPEKDIDEVLSWWYRKEESTEESTTETPEVSMEELDLATETAPVEESVEEPVEETAEELTEETTEEEEARNVEKTGRRGRKSGFRSTLLMYLHDLVFLLSGLILVFLLLFRVVVVSGTSMNSTLLDGDYLLLLSNTLYHNPQQGDIIVASKQSFDNGAPIVKRVIATEGQWVDIDFAKGIVYVGDSQDDMHPLDEPYTYTPTNAKEGVEFPLKVSPGCLFVMGDNRNNSKDSRHPEIGMLDKREVLGKVFFLILPGTNEGHEKQDFGRIGVVD